MNEINRARYLQAMGIDSYVSRHQLAGAAPTRRLALVSNTPTPAVSETLSNQAASVAGVPPQMPTLELARDKPAPKSTPKNSQKPPSTAVRFSLAAVFSGGIAWVESLDGRPLAKEQVQLVRGMARAVHGEVGSPRIAQLDWPIHNNPQLDQGEEAAKAGVAAFLLRHIEEQKCRALVVMGSNSGGLLPAALLGDISRVDTLSTVEMLENPDCKKQVWADLQSIVLQA
ncbi:MAG: hypothetical protein ABJN62_19075 [Halioglobus sp.]